MKTDARIATILLAGVLVVTAPPAVANKLNRFAIGDRDPLKYNPAARSISTSSTKAPDPGRSRTGCQSPTRARWA